MSKLQELIDHLCPNGVEFKPLGEIAEIGTGSSDKKDAEVNGSYPFFVRSKIVERQNSFEYNEEAVIIPGEGGIGEIFHYINGPYALHQRVYRIHFTSDSVNTRFAYYYLFAHFKGFIMKKAVSATVTSIRKPMIETFLLAIPPLEVQDEIVKILDRFADYAAELQAELQARRLQYEYYRNLLLTFNPSAYGCGTDDAQKISVIARGGHSYEIQWKTMGEICKKTKNIKWKDNPTKECLYIDLSSVDCETHGFSNQLITINAETAPSRAQQIVETNDVLFGTTRPTLMRFAIVPQKLSGNICSTGYVVLRANAEIVLPKFLYFILNTRRFLSFVENNQEGAGYPSISLSKLQSFYLPIPPLELQEKIVAILDRFETLVNDLSKGLPAEIEAVKARYEYYRNKLLTFNPLSA